MSFALMGCTMQSQGHVQMVTRLADSGHKRHGCSYGPRWTATTEFSVSTVHFRPSVTRAELIKRGHVVKPSEKGTFGFGGAQLIHRLDDGYCAGSDHRKDGLAIGF